MGRFAGLVRRTAVPREGDTMTEPRQVWVEPNEVRGGRKGLVEGQTTTLRVEATWFALRKWDGTEPVPADTVVKVVETRPYGSYLVTEVPDGPAVKRAIKALRPMVGAMPCPGGVGELIGRFPEEGETPVPVDPVPIDPMLN